MPPVNRHEGTSAVTAGNTRRPMGLDGRLSLLAGLNNTTPGTVEVALMTLPLPRGILNADLKGLRIRSWFVTAANGFNKTVSVRFNSVTGTVIYTTGAVAANAQAGLLDVYLIRTGPSAWESFGEISYSSASGARSTGVDQMNAGITLVITATTPTAAGDITQRGLILDMMNEGFL